MKAKHIAFLSLSVLAGTFASCTGSHEIKITGSVKNLDGGTIIYQKFHDSVSWFTRVIGRDDGAKELQTRIGEAIRDLAKLRDEVLAKKWNDEKYNEEVDNLKKKVADLLDAAASRKAEDLE
jgi:hypothetical protein